MANPRQTLKLAKILIVLFGFTGVLFSWTKAAPPPVIAENVASQYLSRFGYLPEVTHKNGALITESQFGHSPEADSESKNLISKNDFSQAISDFQSFMGLDVTGVLDPETTRVMSLPRCGVKDKIRTRSEPGRSKRFALFNNKWPKKNLTYKISKYTNQLSRTHVDREITRAFAVWSDYTDLTFTPKKGEVDIDIRFVVGSHGDNNAFDGPSTPWRSSVLAHAFEPNYGIGGDAHFDDSERWTINTHEGINLFQVAAHEFGHSLGLDHSQVRAALMAPVYRSYQPNFQLHEDDIVGIQSLYGQKTGNGGFDLCENPQIDTIFGTDDGYVYVFKGDRYWRLTSNGIESGYPKLIATGWRGLPSNIDAAFTHNGRTYFFKGSEYWTYIGNRMENRYSKKTYRDFPGLPNDINAATVSSRDGHVYFFKGTKFWRFNLNEGPPFNGVGPKEISGWPGVPENVDAVISYNGHTYFFKGTNYYKFNDRTLSIVTGSPFQIGPDWYGCRRRNTRPTIKPNNWWEKFFSRFT